jgi:hypothetical protein
MAKDFSTTKEVAKAVQKGSEAALKAMELAEKAGPFLSRVFGPPVENAIGLVADRLAFYRLAQFYRLRDKVKKLLGQRGIVETRLVPPRFAIALLEAATVEDDDTLHDWFARLLANAMDPAFTETLRPAFVSILKDFSPIDAKLFLYLAKRPSTQDFGFYAYIAGRREPFVLEAVAREIGVTVSDAEISLLNLVRLQCVSFVHAVDGTIQYATATTGPSDITQPVVTPLGRALLWACGQKQS